MTETVAYAAVRQASSASLLSHAETPGFPAFRRYPAFSCGVQRNSTRAVAGFLMGGLPLGRLGGVMADIVPVQIILDKPYPEAHYVSVHLMEAQMKNAKRIQELRDQISKLMPKAESGEQWAEICRIEAEIVALGGDTNGL